MKKTISIFMCIAVLSGFMVGCKSENKSTASFKENVEAKKLDFDFKVDPETFLVCVTNDGVEEKVSEPFEKREVADLNQSKDEVSWTYPKDKNEVSIKRVEKVLKRGYNFNLWFIDCDATGEVYDDYSKVIAKFSDKDYTNKDEKVKANSLTIYYADKTVEYSPN
ncbi:MAG: glycoside hydrolase [Clostridioides sp.]|jgi:hypothetical protein|nr:glycoside hydrolase [Clostridioides sp.]